MVNLCSLLPGTQDPTDRDRGECGHSTSNGCTWACRGASGAVFPLPMISSWLDWPLTLSHIISAFTCKCLCHLVRDPKLHHLKPRFKLIFHPSILLNYLAWCQNVYQLIPSKSLEGTPPRISARPHHSATRRECPGSILQTRLSPLSQGRAAASCVTTHTAVVRGLKVQGLPVPRWEHLLNAWF